MRRPCAASPASGRSLRGRAVLSSAGGARPCCWTGSTCWSTYPHMRNGHGAPAKPPHLDSIFRGDCLELLRSMPPSSVDLVVSSPPYNLGKEYEARRALQVYLEEQTEVLRECVRVLKPSGSIFWQVGAFSDDGALIPLDIRFFPILEGLGLIPKNRIAWARQHGLHATRKFSCRSASIRPR